MTQYRKKPVVITAITFEQLVSHGIKQCQAEGRESNIVNGMPWSFAYGGHPITHEHDDCYIIPTLEGSMMMGRNDMLITGVKGEIYPCKREIFDATYDSVSTAPESTLPPHQQRVVDEHAELRDLLAKLDAFILDNPVFLTLPEAEQGRLKRQSSAMALYADILAERISYLG
ncbi:MAG: hypothetical protein RSD57_15940 [Comamonas sp.]